MHLEGELHNPWLLAAPCRGLARLPVCRGGGWEPRPLLPRPRRLRPRGHQVSPERVLRGGVVRLPRQGGARGRGLGGPAGVLPAGAREQLHLSVNILSTLHSSHYMTDTWIGHCHYYQLYIIVKTKISDQSKHLWGNGTAF